LFLSSSKTLNAYLLSVINFCVFVCISFSSLFSQVSTKRNTTLLSFLNLSTAFCIPGNDALHGPHQVAQKSTIITFPFSEARDTILPSRFFKVKVFAVPLF